MGNVADRFVQRDAFPPQAVVDWVSFGRMTFNLADVFIVVGIAFALFASWTPDQASDRL